MESNQLKLTVYFLLLFLVAVLSSCGQLSSLQSAKVLEKGTTTIGGAIFGYGIDDNSASGGDIGSGVFPHVEVLARRGISNNFDMGLKLSSGANMLLDGKYQLAGKNNSKIALAIGAGLEFQASDFQENFVFRTHLPIYFSFHPNEKTAIYTTGRYVFQSVSNDDNAYFIGGNLGFSYQLSPKFTGLLEGSIYQPNTPNNTTEKTYLFQIGIGVLYHLN